MRTYMSGVTENNDTYVSTITHVVNPFDRLETLPPRLSAVESEVVKIYTSSTMISDIEINYLIQKVRDLEDEKIGYRDFLNVIGIMWSDGTMAVRIDEKPTPVSPQKLSIHYAVMRTIREQKASIADEELYQ